MKLGPAQQYFAETSIAGRFGVRLQVMMKVPKMKMPLQHREPLATLEPVLELINEATSLTIIAPTEMPSFRAFYNAQEHELRVEDIRKGCLLSGQGFARRTFSDFYSLVPTAKTIYLANVLHWQTAKLIRDALEGRIPTILDDVASPGPLIKALLGSGSSEIHAVREGDSTYIGLRARLPEN